MVYNQFYLIERDDFVFRNQLRSTDGIVWFENSVDGIYAAAYVLLNIINRSEIPTYDYICERFAKYTLDDAGEMLKWLCIDLGVSCYDIVFSLDSFQNLLRSLADFSSSSTISDSDMLCALVDLKPLIHF